jgi:YHS domain-containing protein
MNRPPASHIFDPICGMWLEASQVVVTLTYIGWTYAFCCEDFGDLFARTPDVHVVRLAHDPEACLGHWCPFLRQSTWGCAARENTGKQDE